MKDSDLFTRRDAEIALLNKGQQSQRYKLGEIWQLNFREIREAFDEFESKAVKPECRIIFDIPYYFCGSCKTMLNMYATKAKYCSKCGKAVKWQ